MPDEDAPDDVESVRFWCTTGSRYTDKEKMKLEMAASATVKTTPDAMGSLLGENSSAAPLALTNGASPSAGPSHSLESLLSCANQSLAPGGAGAKAKCKAKAKAKAKSMPGSQTEKSPAEKREAARASTHIRKNGSLVNPIDRLEHMSGVVSSCFVLQLFPYYLA